MSTKLTKIQGDDGEDIYIQYDDEEADELQAVGYIDDIWLKLVIPLPQKDQLLLSKIPIRG